MRLNLSIAALISFSISAGLLTSAATGKQFGPISAAARCNFSRSRPAITTLAPSRANATAIALPIPLPPPVMMADFPDSRTLKILPVKSGLPQPSCAGGPRLLIALQLARRKRAGKERRDHGGLPDEIGNRGRDVLRRKDHPAGREQADNNDAQRPGELSAVFPAQEKHADKEQRVNPATQENCKILHWGGRKFLQAVRGPGINQCEVSTPIADDGLRAATGYPDGGQEKRDGENDERDQQDLLTFFHRHKLPPNRSGPGIWRLTLCLLLR